MPATNVVLIDGVQPTTTNVVSLFVSPINGGGTRIGAFTAVNMGVTTEYFRAYIVPAGQSVADQYCVLGAFSLNAQESVSPPEIQNQMLNAGETLQVSVSSPTTITFRASGLNF